MKDAIDTYRCRCSCGCGAHLGSGGTEGVCASCSRQYMDESGKVVCITRHDPENEPCPRCGAEIEWGEIRMLASSGTRGKSGDCRCRNWALVERSNGWLYQVLSLDDEVAFPAEGGGGL